MFPVGNSNKIQCQISTRDIDFFTETNWLYYKTFVVINTINVFASIIFV